MILVFAILGVHIIPLLGIAPSFHQYTTHILTWTTKKCSIMMDITGTDSSYHYHAPVAKSLTQKRREKRKDSHHQQELLI